MDDLALSRHRAHDYRHLTSRWRAVARRCRIRLRQWGTGDGIPLYSLRTPALKANGGVYISAGIHGDEPAATEALIVWAESQGEGLRDIPLLLYPCLNPWGLSGNQRFNSEGVDLNRSFHLADHPVIGAWRESIGNQQFSLALMLHEDYDAQGIYVYENQRNQPYWGEKLIAAARPLIPVEPRLKVDGRKSAAGVISPRVTRQRLREIGYPEAIYLHDHHSARTFTVETPSEFSLTQRVAAQIAVIEESLRLALQV